MKHFHASIWILCFVLFYIEEIEVASADLVEPTDIAFSPRNNECKFNNKYYHRQHGVALEKSCEYVKCTDRGTWKILNAVDRFGCNVCRVWNDPHHKSGDGKRFNFHKKCEYALMQRAKLNSPVGEDHVERGIYSEYGKCHGTFRKTCLKKTTIKFNSKVTICFTHAKEIPYKIEKKVSATIGDTGDLRDLPHGRGNRRTGAFVSGSLIPGDGDDVLLFATRNRRRRRPNGPGRRRRRARCISVVARLTFVKICPSSVSIHYRLNKTGTEEEVNGMCGNFNNWRKDDFRLSNGHKPVGTRRQRVNAFGLSWKVPNDCIAEKERIEEDVDVSNEDNCPNFRTHLATCTETVNEYGPHLNTFDKESLTSGCVEDLCATVRDSANERELKEGLDIWIESTIDNTIQFDENVLHGQRGDNLMEDIEMKREDKDEDDDEDEDELE